jgi:hypothetical protein
MASATAPRPTAILRDDLPGHWIRFAVRIGQLGRYAYGGRRRAGSVRHHRAVVERLWTWRIYAPRRGTWPCCPRPNVWRVPTNRWIGYTRANQTITLLERMLAKEPGRIRPRNLLIVGPTNKGRKAQSRKTAR